MQKLLSKFLSTMFFTLVFASPCFADVILTYPTDNTTVNTDSVTFKWENTDTTDSYCYAVEVGPYVEDDNYWSPRIGLETVNTTTYTYVLSDSYIGKLKWWLRYGIYDGTKCEKRYSSTISAFAFKPTEQVTQIIEKEPLPLVKGESTIKKPEVVVKKEEIVKPKVSTKDTIKKKPFVFPLSTITGVTQWHGNTTYQKPHKGIDFGATKQTVVAVAKGTVVGKGWDSTKGDCFSGGNYVLIQQNNGMYTAYFHLKSISVDVGQKVKASQTIGVSGNTGTWNCQPLAYHLHFETRKERAQSSHVNPVEYISVDWNIVTTLNSKTNPGRLSGDNPHPGT